MYLFKRILISLFPDDLVNQPINPASMFISFISAKQYFSVINRKIVENYKLNLFDVSLDSFDVKIGFGDQANIKMNDIDFYYAYGVAANLNGYRFLAPSNIGSCVSIVTSIYMKDLFAKDEYKYLNNFLVAVYLMTFIMISRLKVFPNKSKEEDYKWFIETFFSFYYFVISQTGENIDMAYFNNLKKKLLKNIQVFFMLYYYYKRLNNVFKDDMLAPKEYYKLLFYDELKKGNYKIMVSEFVENHAKYSGSTKLTSLERKIMNLVFPADILIRYIFEGEDIFMVIDHLIQEVYDKKELDKYLSGFLKNDNGLEHFITYISDYKLFKENYFNGLKKFTIHKFKNGSNYDLQEEMDELMSSVGNGENLENVKIPDRIKKESMLMERFINFYVTFIGSFWIARGDNFFVRLFRTGILKELIKSSNVLDLEQDALFFFGGLLYNYSKNVFYYKSAYENVRAGKDRFNLPFRSSFKEVYSNSIIIKLFDENFITTILQDIYTKDIKIYIQNKEILKIFKVHFGKEISKFVNLNNQEIINLIYGPIGVLLSDIEEIDDVFGRYLNDEDVQNLKESIYTMDFWIWYKFVKEIAKSEISLNLRYSDFSILGIIAILRDTLFGYLCFVTYVNDYQKEKKKDLQLEILDRIYLLDVIGLSQDYVDLFIDLITKLNKKYSNILKKWISLDDNNRYFKLGCDNWSLFVNEKDGEKVIADIGGEDIIWFRGYLKNVTFYNKRYLIPKE